MADLRDLYQQVILDHSRKPRNAQKPKRANRLSEGYNPLCGDQIHLYLELDGEVIRDIGFEGAGCAISKASTSMMTESVKGKTRGEALSLFRKFRDLVTGDDGHVPNPSELGKLIAFSGVTEFPVRVKCATLSWHTLRAALEGKGTAISTE
jgi:nitrogen fixation NifU-like protein